MRPVFKSIYDSIPRTDSDTESATFRIINEIVGSASLSVRTSMGIEAATALCHGLAVESGWWKDPATGEPKERNDGELICLMHSELSEAMEGVRKNKQDDHLPHRKSVEVELADCLIRIFDYAGARGLDLSGAVIEKLAYNQQRQDHTLAARAKADGKKF